MPRKKSHFDVFGGWVGFEKTCVTFRCCEMLKRNGIMPVSTTYLSLSSNFDTAPCSNAQKYAEQN